MIRKKIENPTPSRASDDKHMFGMSKRFLLISMWGLHLTCGLLVLLAGLVFPQNSILASILKWMANFGGMLFPLLKTAQDCQNVGLLAQAVGTVVFLTGHMLLIGYLLSVLVVMVTSSEPDTSVAPTFWEAVFWDPCMLALGVGIYWTTYLHMATAGHIICPSNPIATWFFRVGSTSTAPFVVAMVVGPLLMYGKYIVKLGKFMSGRKY